MQTKPKRRGVQMFHIYKVISDPVIDFAAEELKKYLRMMMPRAGEIKISLDPNAKDGFRLGTLQSFGLDASEADDPRLDDILHIDTDENGGIIGGSNTRSVLLSVYRFLRENGCRFLFPGVDGEYIPMKPISPVKYHKMADHRYRGQCNEGAEFQQSMIDAIDFTPKIGLNTFMLEFDNPYIYYSWYYEHLENLHREPEYLHEDTVLQWKRQCEVEIAKRGLLLHDMGHGWTSDPYGVDSKTRHKDTTDYPEEISRHFAMLNGKRVLAYNSPIQTNVCMSNPETRKILVDAVAEYAEKQNNVDFLHVWLSDGRNVHCECPECQKKDTSDWYMILLNEIDAELEKRNLDTHLVFIVYNDTFWPPIVERLNNPKRFSMLFAPGSRLYTQDYGQDARPDLVTPYNRNHCQFPKGMGESLGYLQKWKETFSGDCFCYEYHFYRHQTYDYSGLTLAKLVHNDIKNLKKHGLLGIIEDGSQRSFFPTGFPFFVYAETLFDVNASYDSLVEDYFSHAFGESWKVVLDYLKQIEKLIPQPYLEMQMSADAEKGPYYNPEVSRTAAQVPDVVNAFLPVIEKNKCQRMRASTVSWRLLKYHTEYVLGASRAIERLAVGDLEKGANFAAELYYNFGKYEAEIQTCFDHYMWFRFFRGTFKFNSDRQTISNLLEI